MTQSHMRSWPFVLVAALVLTHGAPAVAAAASQNPDLSVNALVLYKNSNRGYDSTQDNRNGLNLQEAEMQFASDVDPYWRFVGTFSISQSSDPAAATYTPKWGISPEEVYAESIDFNTFTLRVGKFKAALGKHNQLHSHAFPFIDAPLQNTELLADEGLNDAGVSVSTLLPTSWFSEFTLQAFNGQSDDDPYFMSSSPGNFVGVAHFKNLWDLSEELTGEFGLSAASGGNSLGSSTNFYGADLTFKWRKSLERAAIWATEYLQRDLGADRGQGIASWVQCQLTRRWWIEARGEYLTASSIKRKQSFAVAFDPSEFSEIRAQYDHLNDLGQKDEHRAMLQFNYTIGAHPAHSY
jgi:hypothetical protein